MSTAEETPTITAPPTFTDLTERIWTIKLTGSVIEEVLANTQVDLIPDDQDYVKIADLVRSHRQLGAVLWHCVRRQAEQQGIDRVGFLDGFDGRVYALGWGALVDAIHFFIRSLSATQADTFSAMIEAAMRVKDAESRTQIELIQSAATNKALLDAAEQIKRKMQGEIVRGFAKSATNLPEFLGSTPATSP